MSSSIPVLEAETKTAAVFHRSLECLAARPGFDSHIAILSSRLDGNVWDAEIRVADTLKPAAPIYTAVMSHSACALDWLSSDMLAAGDDVGFLQVYSAPSTAAVGVEMRCVAAFAAHDDVVSAVSHVPGNATSCMSASWDGSICLWDLTTGTATAELRGHEGKVNTLAINTASPHLVLSGGNDATDIAVQYAAGKVWDTRTPEASIANISTTTHVTATCWLNGESNENHVILGCCDGSVKLYDLRALVVKPAAEFGASGRHRSANRPATSPLLSLPAHIGAVRCIRSYNGARQFIATSGDDITARICEVAAEGASVLSSRDLPAHTDYVRSLAFIKPAADATLPTLFSASWDQTLRVTSFHE